MSKKDNRENGSALVETAIGSVVMVMLIIGIFDFGRIHYVRSNLKHAVSQSVRFGITGNTMANPEAPGQLLSREASIRKRIRDLSGLNVKNRDVTIGAVNADGEVVSGAGGPGDVVTVQASYEIQLIAPYMALVVPEGKFIFVATTSYRNEEFAALPRDTAPGAIGSALS